MKFRLKGQEVLNEGGMSEWVRLMGKRESDTKRKRKAAKASRRKNRG